MGGSAFMIYGEFDAVGAAAAAPRRTILDRLRNRQPPSVSTTRFPNGRSLLQFPANAIQDPLARNYLTFVNERLAAPSAASGVVLDYLKLGQPTIYLRAERGPSETTGPWYVQVSFSGCAGMSETSARVATHWASHWYAARGEAIRTAVLSPAGFTAESAEPPSAAAFVATAEHGYAEREGETFAIDASFIESHPDPDALMKQLEQQHARQLDDGKCHCEICQEV